MAVLRRCTLVLLLLLAGALRPAAASSAEERAFKEASKAFNDTFYQRAEAQFSRFTLNFTNSSRLPEAYLFQAEARLKLGNFDGAFSLLAAHQAQAARLGDEYLFWMAEARFGNKALSAAADLYDNLVAHYPASRPPGSRHQPGDRAPATRAVAARH